MSTVVPYKFTASKTISPHEVNENARALWRAFKRLEAKRYNHFIISVDIGPLDGDTDDAAEGQFYVNLGFPFDIVATEIVGYGGDDGGTTATGTEAITLTSDNAGLDDLSITVDHDNVTDQKRDFKAQSLSVGSTDSVLFTVSLPTVADAELTATVNVYCRYDILSEASYTLPDPPSVASGESYSVTEWNTWFSNMSSAITSLTTLYDNRKRGIAVNVCRDYSPGAINSPPSGDDYAIFGGLGSVSEFTRVQGQLLSGHDANIDSTSFFGASNDPNVTAEAAKNGGVTIVRRTNFTISDATPTYDVQANSHNRVDLTLSNSAQDVKRFLAIFSVEG